MFIFSSFFVLRLYVIIVNNCSSGSEFIVTEQSALELTYGDLIISLPETAISIERAWRLMREQGNNKSRLCGYSNKINFNKKKINIINCTNNDEGQGAVH